MLRLDPARCSLCDVCTRHCPTGALELEPAGELMRLLFRPRLCDGCADHEGCEAVCPEHAVVRQQGEPGAAQPEQVVLVESPLVECAYCGARFGTVRRLDALSQKRDRDVERELCPLCRRTQLVVRFIETERVPDAKAEYRSARDILRRAGYLSGKRKPPPT